MAYRTPESERVGAILYAGWWRMPSGRWRLLIECADGRRYEMIEGL